tara:strand:- start:1308 stop:1496 length:189 start_codon:yes stop_codon:yes gene_type:complete
LLGPIIFINNNNDDDGNFSTLLMASRLNIFDQSVFMFMTKMEDFGTFSQLWLGSIVCIDFTA